MILILELMDEAVTHAPGNSQWAQVIARALPDHQVRVCAPPAHLRALREDANLCALANVSFREIPLISAFRRQVNVVSPARARAEFAILRRLLAEVPAGESCLVVLASAAPTAVFAARLAGALMRRRVAVQMVLHGFANEVLGWRTRNPLLRRFDLPGLMAAPPQGVRFLALERAIAAELGRIAPAAAGRIDVLPLPVNANEIVVLPPVPLEPPIRLALVGQTTRAKGIEPFLAMARALKARHGSAVEFHVIGRRFPETPAEALAVLDGPPAEGYLDRKDFLARLAAMHYVVLPLQESYYRLSPSGALIDAITWLKPVVATAIPIVAEAFREGGEIGVLCPDVAAMERALDRLVTAPDPAEYARQVAALRRLRDRRLPDALVGTYRRIVETGFRDIAAGEKGAGQG
ncbi:glycosyltransferase family 4 protein [Elioraea sp. Yellowstone]|uniref:glycosyltransferase n=1 Tax=Elioraea sp. Yellowstone TaxID=2592070 RepID=UPI00114D745B|nr:glycosyltransferase [Elioraea sp. Yellowstone]TQF77503.1 glycosyltransferase family 4 protein [Elioraea sp. Yellowstone]